MDCLNQLYLSLVKTKLSRIIKYSIYNYILYGTENSIEERWNCAKMPTENLAQMPKNVSHTHKLQMFQSSPLEFSFQLEVKALSSNVHLCWSLSYVHIFLLGPM